MRSDVIAAHDSESSLRRLLIELGRPATCTRYHAAVASNGQAATMMVFAIRQWCGERGEPVVRPGACLPRLADLHRHQVLLLLDDEDRRALGSWLCALAGTSPRAHLVIEVHLESRRAARALRGTDAGIDVSRVRRLIDAGELVRADAWLSAGEVLALVCRMPLPDDLRLTRGWLRFWQGRFEEAKACAASSAACPDQRLLVEMVAWACGKSDVASHLGRPTRQRAESPLGWLRSADLALAAGDHAAAARMLGPPGPWPASVPWLRCAVVERLRAGVSRHPSGTNRAIAIRGAHGLTRWGLGRSSMYLMHALESLLAAVNDGDDERAALAAVCRWAREHAGADSAVMLAGDDGRALAGEGWRRDSLEADERHAIMRAGQTLTLTRADGLVISAPVRYGGARIGAVVLLGPPERRETMAEGAVAVAGVAASAVRARLTSLAISGDGEALARDILGRSPAMRSLREAIARAAVTPFPVLIEGESGTGKELAARALHRLSARRDRRLATLNCAALSDDLAEAELFGHARGAFTGAVAPRAGLFEDAHGGTLFLDEVGELSPRAQAKLLRALQEREVRRVGENASRVVDVRVIAATNRSLSEMASVGGFRDDLLFRLAVIRLQLPPLRERTEDIATLAHVFWRGMLAEANKRAVLGADAVARLVCHRWPGNVRELQNVIAGLVVLAPGRGRVGVRHVEHVLAAYGARPIEPPMSLSCARLQAERRAIAAALARHRGRRAEAARDLGVTPPGLSQAVRRVRLLTRGEVTEGVA